MQKPYAEACDQNGEYILKVLQQNLPAEGQVLEIGSGTGQHAVMFAAKLPGLVWQTSDRLEAHAGMRLWLDEAQLDNLRSPLPLDVLQDPWPEQQFDAAFSANTAHIMPMEAVEAMFQGLGRVLNSGAPFLLYGPFMYDGEHTSPSNLRFDRWLKAWEPHRGVRDLMWLKQIAEPVGLHLEEDIEMPANNRILLWRHG